MNHFAGAHRHHHRLRLLRLRNASQSRGAQTIIDSRRVYADPIPYLILILHLFFFLSFFLSARVHLGLVAWLVGWLAGWPSSSGLRLLANSQVGFMGSSVQERISPSHSSRSPTHNPPPLGCGGRQVIAYRTGGQAAPLPYHFP